MKIKYFFLAVLAMSLMTAFTSCSDDDDDSPVEPQKTAELKLDADTLIIEVGGSSTFNITDGGGDYKVFIENSDVATVTLDGNTVTVQSLKLGKTGVVVSDAQGNYKRIPVKCMYMHIILDKETVDLGMKLGHTDGVAKVTVTAGNGVYQAVSADETIAKISGIADNVITIQGVKQGTTTVTITDQMGLSKTVTVNVQTTTIPFTEDEKADVLALTSNKFNWDGTNSYTWGTYKCETDNGQQYVYWNYYNYYYCKVWFDSDLSVGKKTNGKIQTKMSWGASKFESDNVDIEILKNDGTRLWGIMSVIKDDYLHTGYFCVAL